MDFDFTLPEESSAKRQSFRVTVPGLEIRIKEKKTYYPVRDLSAGGVSFASGQHTFRMTEMVLLDITLNKKLFIPEVEAKVVRVGKGVTAVAFQKMEFEKECKLDKLVVEVQKRVIELKKKKRQKESN